MLLLRPRRFKLGKGPIRDPAAILRRRIDELTQPAIVEDRQPLLADGVEPDADDVTALLVELLQRGRGNRRARIVARIGEIAAQDVDDFDLVARRIEVRIHFRLGFLLAAAETRAARENEPGT